MYVSISHFEIKGFYEKNAYLFSRFFFTVTCDYSVSFFPWLLKNLSLEEGAGVGMDSGQFDAAIRPYLILGFVVATILSVWLLTFLFIKFSKDKKIFTTLFILSIYIWFNLGK